MNKQEPQHTIRWPRKVGMYIGGVFFALLLLLLILLLLTFDFSPKHLSPTQLSGHEFNQTANFIRRMSNHFIGNTSTVAVKASKKELQSTLIFTERSKLGLSGSVDMQQDLARFKVSIKMPIGFPAYMNTEFSLVSAKKGITLADAKIGSLKIGDKLANTLFTSILKTALGKSYALRVTEGINNLSIDKRKMRFDFTPIGNTRKDFAKAAKRISQYAGQEIRFKSDRLQHYVDTLTKFNSKVADSSLSIGVLISALISEAKTQSQKEQNNAHVENLHALYSIAIQMSPDLFSRFTPELDVSALRQSKNYTLTLNKRKDLAKHFVSSMGLHILAESGVSFSIGEAKELIDAIKGGSGFSFADLAADRCGIHFSSKAISQSHAEALQIFIDETLQESDFFPTGEQLPEGLSQEEFEKQYSDMESKQYKTMIDEIDRLIKDTSIFVAVSSNESNVDDTPYRR